MFEHPFKWSTPPVRIINGTVEVFLGWSLPHEYKSLRLDQVLEKLLNHKGLLEENRSISDGPCDASTTDVTSVFETIMKTNMHKYVDLLNMPEFYVWGQPWSSPDRMIDAEGQFTSRSKYRVILFSNQLGDCYQNHLAESDMYLHRYWAGWQSKLRHLGPSSMAVCSFTKRYCAAIREIFAAHPEKRDAFAMACRMRDDSIPAGSPLLYMLNTATGTDPSYVPHRDFERRMKHFELNLQAKCVLGSDCFTERKKRGTIGKRELQDLANQMTIECLPVSGNLTHLQPSYQQILAKARDSQADEVVENEQRSSSTVKSTEMAARVLELLIQTDKHLATMKDGEVSYALIFLQDQLAKAEQEDVDIAIKMAARVIEMLIEAENCLSELTDEEKSKALTVLIDWYAEAT